MLLNGQKLQAKETINVAVAANFLAAMTVIAAEFEQKKPVKINLISGSSGKLYAQIQNGAPYHLFFSADQSKPAALEKSNFALKNSRFTYAQGQLALWSFKPDQRLNLKFLQTANFKHLAVANPKLAPYGAAAIKLLKDNNLYQRLKPKLVFGENVAQCMQFIVSGNADVGIIALSQYRAKRQQLGGSVFVIPQDLYPPVIQDAVLLKAAKKSLPAKAFYDFFATQEVAAILHGFGYKSLGVAVKNNKAKRLGV